MCVSVSVVFPFIRLTHESGIIITSISDRIRKDFCPSHWDPTGLNQTHSRTTRTLPSVSTPCRRCLDGLPNQYMEMEITQKSWRLNLPLSCQILPRQRETISKGLLTSLHFPLAQIILDHQTSYLKWDRSSRSIWGMYWTGLNWNIIALEFSLRKMAGSPIATWKRKIPRLSISWRILLIRSYKVCNPIWFLITKSNVIEPDFMLCDSNRQSFLEEYPCVKCMF